MTRRPCGPFAPPALPARRKTELSSGARTCTMEPEMQFGYTGLRVRDIDEAVGFFTKVMGMKLRSKVDATWNKGVFANLGFPGEAHYLELSWYAPDSPHYTGFVEGDQLDHLGFKVKDFNDTLRRLEAAGYSVKIGPIHEGKWHFAFVRGYDGIWLDIYHVDEDWASTDPLLLTRASPALGHCRDPANSAASSSWWTTCSVGASPEHFRKRASAWSTRADRDGSSSSSTGTG